MSVIIGADNGTLSGAGGLKLTGDSSGIVQLTSGANTTTVTLNSNNSVTMGNTYINGTTVHNYNPGPTSTQLAVLQLNGANTKGGIGYSDFLQATNIAPGSNNTNKFFRIDNNGQLQIINSAYTNNIFNLSDGGQLTLANTLNFNASAGVNGINFNNNTSGVQTESTLNDYETGTWTVTLSPASGTITIDSTRQQMNYTKIGNLVSIHGYFRVQSSVAASGIVSMSLPFTVFDNRPGNGQGLTFTYDGGSAPTSGYWPYGYTANATATCYLRFWNGTSSIVELGNLVGSTSEFWVSGSYQAAF